MLHDSWGAENKLYSIQIPLFAQAEIPPVVDTGELKGGGNLGAVQFLWLLLLYTKIVSQ